MGSKFTAMVFVLMVFMLIALPPIDASVPCRPPHSPPYHLPTHPKIPRLNPPTPKHPPYHGGGSPKVEPPSKKPPMPPVIVPPIPTPPVISPPITNPPVTIPPPSGGGSSPAPPTSQPTCPVNALKLGLCVDGLGGLGHIGLGNPVENACCPVLGGLLELETAVCLCTAIRLELLNINIFIPLALQAIITCGKNPPPGFICPLL
ncbi:hypothetical protein ES319_D09G210200v1 [Gossypium barbadense]|uniref:Hydrophobic seed protein domain-containing protein n=1 Tax=Gossypium barbadense TaxID=3634 RepID=A0A5J5Q6V0_GOSBA|nr:hypothetical protein ES319_D09G210200v1 [Gossypium barbadense]PPD66963.1 hypothetical protein GOBAR_DD36160 [Gossypium barbadense]